MYKFIGIDVSKQTFDVYSLSKEAKPLIICLDNNKRGFAKLIKTYEKDGVYVMEATGPYYVQLATYLYKRGIKVSVVNPLIIRRYAQMRLIRAKTDKKDAQTIFEYASQNSLKLWKPDSQEVINMQQILTAIELLNKQITATGNQLKSFKSSGNADNMIKNSLGKIIKKLKFEKLNLEKRLNEIIDEHFTETRDLLKTIPGIGPKAIAVLIAITNNFQKFIHYKQLIAYVGLSPRIYSSGTSIKGKGHICKMGKSQVRKQMYLSAWSAKFHNKACIELYERLKNKNKNERVIKIAIANKLLKQAFAIVNNKQIYNSSYVSKLNVA
ncbi:MAG: IS110 family transposase [Bacteroidetes bacterium]|nr:IS110 family transposase [Bacteroidota bacterium]